MSRLKTVTVGEQMWLTPNTIGCATACWKQPKVTIVSTANRPVIAVELPDGEVIRTHEDNLVTTQPKPPRTVKKSAPRPAAVGCEEVPLW